MIISCTGHRPPSIGGYKIPNPTYNWIYKETSNILTSLKPELVIVGGALGFDTLAALACIELNIPIKVAVPFLGQEKMWPKSSQDIYHDILSKAKETYIVSSGSYSANKMQIRNEYMVDNSNVVLACWDGTKSGGTFNCFDYVLSKNKKYLRIDPKLKVISSYLSNGDFEL